MGVTFAVLNLVGYWPCSIDILKIQANSSTMVSGICFIVFMGMLSTPLLNFGFRVEITSFISLGVVGFKNIEFSTDLLK